MESPRRYGDHRPYVIPVQLDDLAGPTGGVIELPQSLAWTGRHDYDLDDAADANVFYERVIVEAAEASDLATLLDASLLRRVWSTLYLPQRVRRMWEARFPELSVAA